MDNIQQLASRILEQTNINQSLLSEEKRQAVLKQISQELSKRLIIAALAQLKTEDLNEYDELLSRSEPADSGASVSFLQSKIPNLAEIMQNTAAEFINELKNDFNK